MQPIKVIEFSFPGTLYIYITLFFFSLSLSLSLFLSLSVYVCLYVFMCLGISKHYQLSFFYLSDMNMLATVALLREIGRVGLRTEVGGEMGDTANEV